MDLTEVYFEVVYPIFPLFHRPTLFRRVARGEYLTDRAYYASVMSMCALASARARDGALYSNKWAPDALREPSSEAFCAAAESALPKDAPLTQSLDYMRACALLAINFIQYGDSPKMHYYLGLYNTFVAVGGLHDEANWPKPMDYVQMEERRRLFWSTYTLDVFTSIIWNRLLNSREARTHVSYPTEADDQMFNEATPINAYLGSSLSWLRGWNLTTDLYRIIEHAAEHMRTQSQQVSSVQALFGRNTTPQSAVLDHIMAMYTALPGEFKITQPVTCNLNQDLFSFQAANIAATVQLARMVLFTSEHSTVEQKCQVASEVIHGFAGVPVAYLQAISIPLLHHLAGIGTILGSAFEDGLSEQSYRRVRSVLLELADLLATFEVGLFTAAGTSDKLRSQVSRIDEYMEGQRQRLIATQAQSQPQGQDVAGARRQHPGAPGSYCGSDISSDHALLDPAQGLQSGASPQFQFPPELFEDWSWAFDFSRTTDWLGEGLAGQGMAGQAPAEFGAQQ